MCRHILFRILMALVFSTALKAQVVLAPIKNSPWPKRCFSAQDSTEAQQFIKNELKRLHKKGYVLASVDSLEPRGDTLWIFLHQGLKWNYVLLDPFPSASGTPKKPERLTPKIWAELKEKTLDELHKAGHAQAAIQLRPKPDALSSTLLTIEAIIEPGPALFFDSVQCSPNTVLAPKVLQHLSGVYPQHPAQLKQVEQGSRSLSSVGLLPAGSLAQLTQRSRKVDVQWPLQKAKSNRFSGILGLMPENNQTGGFLITGELDLALDNLLGYTEKISLTWQRLQTATQQLKVQAAWPFLFGTRLGWIGDFSLFRIDSAFAQIEGKTGLSWKPSGMDLVAGFVQIRQSSVAPGAENPSLGWLQASTLSAGLHWQQKSLDDPITPRKGHLFNLTASTGQRTFQSDTIGDPNTKLVLEFEAEAALIRPVFKRWVAFLRTHAWWLYSPQLLMSETRRLGGLHSLRGVDEESLYATWFAYANSEIRYVFDPGSWFQLFVDAGRFGLDLNQSKRSQWQLGMGAGLTFLTPAGSFSVLYALGIVPGEAAGFGQSKIHIGYQARW